MVALCRMKIHIYTLILSYNTFDFNLPGDVIGHAENKVFILKNDRPSLSCFPCKY